MGAVKCEDVRRNEKRVQWLETYDCCQYNSASGQSRNISLDQNEFFDSFTTNATNSSYISNDGIVPPGYSLYQFSNHLYDDDHSFYVVTNDRENGLNSYKVNPLRYVNVSSIESDIADKLSEIDTYGGLESVMRYVNNYMQCCRGGDDISMTGRCRNYWNALEEFHINDLENTTNRMNREPNDFYSQNSLLLKSALTIHLSDTSPAVFIYSAFSVILIFILVAGAFYQRSRLFNSTNNKAVKSQRYVILSQEENSFIKVSTTKTSLYGSIPTVNV